MLKFWKDRLATEQAQFEALRRRINELNKWALEEKEPITKVVVDGKIAELKPHLQLMESMHETLRDHLGKAGILKQIEER